MFGLVIDPRLTINPDAQKNPTLPHQGLVWQCRVTRRCHVRVWFGVGLVRGVLAYPVRLKKVPLIQKQDPRVP